jgi:two-component system OmpR family sensor kinase
MNESPAYYAPSPPSAAPAPAAPYWPPPPTAVDGTGRQSPRPWRFVPRSLTNRLVAGVVVLAVLLVAVVGGCTFLALRSFLYHRLDQQVESVSNLASINSLLHLRLTPGLQVPQTVYVAVLDKSGAPSPEFRMPSAREISPMVLSAQDSKALAHGTNRPVSRTTADGTHLRVVAVSGLTLQAVDASTGAPITEPVTVVVGLSTLEIDRTLHRLVLLELIIGAAAVAVAFAATSWGVRRSLRNLYQVTDTASEVAAELSPDGRGLDRRVAVAEEGTEVGALAESMNTLLSAVETQFAARLESEQRMRQFLADASHELRTPLTSIRGYAELARMRGDSAADDLSRIEAEGTRMSRLVDDLLTLTRSEQAQAAPELQLVDITDVLADVVDSARAAYPQRRIDLVAPPGLHVLGDPDQLVRVVRNLVTNAAVHTDPSGPIGVHAERDGANVIVRVTDHGPGLPPEEAAHVFERFWRADRARTRARGGSGLGLSIVASLVRANGGTVRFDSSVEAGSTATVRLPAAAV